MAKKLKDHYNINCARLIASKIGEHKPDFQKDAFVQEISRKIRGQSFLARQDVFASALVDYLDSDYLKSLDYIHKLLGPKLQQETGMFTYGYWLWPFGRWIEQQAPKHPKHLKQSLNLIYELTQRFTGEFAIRPLLDQHSLAVLKVMNMWSLDSSVHVRRLASEGLRVRLPWAKKLDVFHNHFEECQDILFNLRQAPEKFVQKSVGNNINDLYKDRPDLAKKLVQRLSSSKPMPNSTQWIIRHGQRSLRK